MTISHIWWKTEKEDAEQTSAGSQFQSRFQKTLEQIGLTWREPRANEQKWCTGVYKEKLPFSASKMACTLFMWMIKLQSKRSTHPILMVPRSTQNSELCSTVSSHPPISCYGFLGTSPPFTHVAQTFIIFPFLPISNERHHKCSQLDHLSPAYISDWYTEVPKMFLFSWRIFI